MTENNAKTKWCPFVRSDNADNAINRWTDGDYSIAGPYQKAFLCIGSECMAWRATDNEIQATPSGPVEFGRARNASDYVSAGYCGLVGKP